MRAGFSAAEKFGCTRGKKHLCLPWTVHASCWLNFDSSLIWLTNQIQLNWLILPEMGKKVTVLFHFVSQNLSLETINDSSTLREKVHSKQKCDFFFPMLRKYFIQIEFHWELILLRKKFILVWPPNDLFQFKGKPWKSKINKSEL